ncbi:uncharacterized protein LOC135385235 isoform X5 [Ornithodoros turicata]|uniref:uncharacterized protein LOC135385235 isoform X5 n=1 Tax=Ornithodoros turicata TaxID=34597 RepID=UPI003139A8FF
MLKSNKPWKKRQLRIKCYQKCTVFCWKAGLLLRTNRSSVFIRSGKESEIPLNLAMGIELGPLVSPPVQDADSPETPTATSLEKPTAAPARSYPARFRRPPVRYQSTALGGRNVVDVDD